MLNIVKILVILLINFCGKSESADLSTKENAENRGRDTFFDYAELTEPQNYYYYKTSGSDLNNYSSNVDVELFVGDDGVILEL